MDAAREPGPIGFGVHDESVGREKRAERQEPLENSRLVVGDVVAEENPPGLR
jgi:hypothetical protein